METRATGAKRRETTVFAEAGGGGRRIGYARVSTRDQVLDSQLRALEAAACDVVFHDVITGTAKHRPGLDAALAACKAGDTLVVYRLDRLGRSLIDLITLSDTLKARGVKFISLTEGIDTSTIVGDFFLKVLGALAEFERRVIVERTVAGLHAARARGVVLGRPRTRVFPRRLNRFLRPAFRRAA